MGAVDLAFFGRNRQSSGCANLSRYGPFPDANIRYQDLGLGMKIVIELDRKDVLALVAVLLLTYPVSGGETSFRVGESLLYLIHRNNVHADAMLGPIGKGAKNGA